MNAEITRALEQLLQQIALAEAALERLAADPRAGLDEFLRMRAWRVVERRS